MESIYKIFLEILKFFHSFTHNYGVDIIILTILVRIILFPITAKGLKSMKRVQSLQPRIKEIQEKYKDDKEKLNKELLALYKEVGFNPFSGCLPMLLQIPIFIILFTILRDSRINEYMFVNASFLGLDLTTPTINHFSGTFLGDIKLILPLMYDMSIFGFNGLYIYIPTTILVAIMAITTFAQQKSMTTDPSQSGQMLFMNIFLIYISTLMQGGVLLYWVVSNIFQIIQQKIIPSEPAPISAVKSSDKKPIKKSVTSSKANKSKKKKKANRR